MKKLTINIKNNIDISVVPFGSALYEGTKTLRQAILRTPWGLRLSAKDLDGEESQIHIAAVDGSGNVRATVILKPLTQEIVKLRQMAVAEAAQGTGLGKRLVLFAEQEAIRRGFAQMELHARVTALGFYEKLGYISEGEPFIEATVPNIRMTKTLSL